MENKKEVKVYLINYICDKCGIGTMKPTGVCLTSYPPYYEHVCAYCGYTTSFRENYPKVMYEEIENEED